MNLYSFKQIDPTKIQLEYQKDGKIIRKLDIRIGFSYKIEPDNKQKKKNRNRKCIVLGFIYDDLNNPMRVKVKFQDSGRNGKADIEDLVEFQ
jgi:hypothetical protein